MKNTKREVENYLKKASKHFYQNEKGEPFEIKFNPETGDLLMGDFTKGEPTSCNGHFKTQPQKINVNNYFDYYKENTKCVIKHRLFLNKKLKSVKRPKVKVESV